jgi:hypothetical protein
MEQISYSITPAWARVRYKSNNPRQRPIRYHRIPALFYPSSPLHCAVTLADDVALGMDNIRLVRFRTPIDAGKPNQSFLHHRVSPGL